MQRHSIDIEAAKLKSLFLDHGVRPQGTVTGTDVVG
jgi:hypothetical protein